LASESGNQPNPDTFRVKSFNLPVNLQAVFLQKQESFSFLKSQKEAFRAKILEKSGLTGV
jgi:hypothetical protein